MTTPVYLDHNATTPVDPRVLAELLPYLTTHFGNPSSSHAYGRPARDALDTARTRVGRLIGSPAATVTFCGSGSECNWLAIVGSILGHHADHRHRLVTQATEHPSVLSACSAVRRRLGVDVATVPVGRDGLVSLQDVKDAVTENTLLVSIQLANAETGTVQPVADIAEIAHAAGALVHVDAAQAAGKIPIDVDTLGADLLTLVGHKMYAPKGVAALYRRAGVVVEPLVGGGGQEAGLRSGTENVPYLVGLGVASDLARHELAGEAGRLWSLRDLLYEQLRQRLGERVLLNGHPTERLPNTLNISIDGVEGAAVLAATPDVAASTGSACHSGSSQPSPVLMAMGLTESRARAALRLTVGRWTTEAEVLRVADALATTVEKTHAVT